MIAVIGEAGTRPWWPPEAGLKKVGRLLRRLVLVVYLHRANLRAWWRLHHQGPPPGGPYNFRAWSRPDLGTAWVLVDPTETMASTAWLTLHELAHLDLVGAGLVRQGLHRPRRPDYWTDAGHQADPEEQTADAVATGLLPLFGFPSQRLDRTWWRRRVEAR